MHRHTTSGARLSKEQPPEPELQTVKLFPSDHFPRLLAHVMQMLNLKKAVLPDTDPEQATELGPSSVLPNYQESTVGFPLLNFFMPLIEKEWPNPTRGRDSSRPSTCLFNLDKEGMQFLRSLLVAAPVAALVVFLVLPSDSKGFPKDPIDMKIELSARRAFDSAASALCVSVASFLSSRIMVWWLQEISKVHRDLFSVARVELHKIISATAYVTDTTTDAIQLVAWTMAASVVVRRHT